MAEITRAAEAERLARDLAERTQTRAEREAAAAEVARQVAELERNQAAMAAEAERTARGMAERERARADTGFAAARQATNGLVFDLAQGLRTRVGVPAETVRLLLGRADAVLDRMIALAPEEADLLRLKAAALSEFATTYATLGDTARQRAAVEEALAITERLAARDAGNAGWQRDLSISHNRVGHVRMAQGDLAGALAAYQAGLAIRERLAALDPGNAGWQRDLAFSHNRVGDTLLRLGAVTGAQRSAEAALAIARDRASRFPDHADSVRDLSAAEGLMRRIEAAVKAGVQ